MHTLLFLDPGHFHAALTLRVPQARAADEVFVYAIDGAFRDDVVAIEQESVHQLEKLVDGAPLRRPWWYFDVRVQGSGLVDIPTHVVDQAQWLVDSDAAAPVLLSARAWSTRVPAEAFRRITGEAGFPRELEPFVDGDALNYRCNSELVYRIS